MLGDHQAGGGDVDPDLDHRRRDENADLARFEPRHDVILVRPFHAAMDQPDARLTETGAEQRGAIFGRGQLARLALGHQRAHPIGPVSYTHLDVYKRQHYLVVPGENDVPVSLGAKKHGLVTR